MNTQTNALTATTPVNYFAGDYSQVTAQPALNFYQYPYNPGYSYYTVWPSNNDARVATLEGEVKVLREMLAALLSGREAKGKRT